MDTIYKKLAEHLNRLPVPFPATDTGVELKILEQWFSEQEAGIALNMKGYPEPVSKIAQRLDMTENELAPVLMSDLKEIEKKFDIIGDVRGMGPLVALELVKDRKTKQPAPEETKAITDYCFEHGLILLSCGTYNNVLRFMMPLVTTDQQMEKGMGILSDAFGQL